MTRYTEAAKVILTVGDPGASVTETFTSHWWQQKKKHWIKTALKIH